MYMSLEGAKVTRRKRNRVRQAHRHMYVRTHAVSHVYVNMGLDERGQWNWVLKCFH